MKKLLALLLAVVMVMSLTAALAENQQVTLKVASIWSAETEANREPVLQTLAEFAAAPPEIKLEVEWYEANQWKDAGESLALSDSLPDVFYWNAGGVLWNLVSSGDILDITPYLTDEIKDQLIGGALANMTFDGKVYQLPYTNACSCLYCNTELLTSTTSRSPKPGTS
jgi:raffinose/stachyose/melibiose transport system substrate-binding protein